MPTFALVTEGITDQVVIEWALRGFCKANSVELEDVVYVRPLRDETDEARAGERGGWERVLEYCSSADHLQETIQINDYLIVQIDTDCGEHTNFGVPLTENGVQKPVGRLIDETIAMLISKMGENLYREFKEKVIFAIAVHSTECWLLALHEADQYRASQTLQCENRLRTTLNKQSVTYEKTYRCYDELSRELRKGKTLANIADINESFRAFLTGLGGATERLRMAQLEECPEKSDVGG